jgi:aspartate aminotransferase
MYEQALKLERAGVDLIHMEFGRPIHDTPAHIKEATLAALRGGHVHYSEMQGETPFRQAIVRKLARYNRIDVDIDSVIVANGLTHASNIVFMAGLDDGDEVILLDPYYPQHLNKIELAGGVPVIAPLDRARGFRFNARLIEPFISRRTKMLVLVNPANPTGRVYSREELTELAELAIRHDLLVVTDEVYEQILFDGAEHISVASLPGMAARTISLFAFTKAYSMDGWRLGYIVCDPSLVPAIMKVSTNDVTHVNTFIQYGGLAALDGPESVLQAMVDDDARKRDLVVQSLQCMRGVRCEPPQATIYAFPNIEDCGMTSTALADELLHKTHVVVEDGSFYGSGGEGHLRICFGSQPYERIVEAMERLNTYFSSR